MEEYEDDGTWIWVSFAPEYRLILSHAVGPRKQPMADKIIQQTKAILSNKPLFVSDGLMMYKWALLSMYGTLQSFPRTGKRGRPQIPILVPDYDLRYAQVIKHRQGGHLSSVERRVIYGQDIDTRQIGTSLIERQNLTFRQDNNRISRKTIGFSKDIMYLDMQMTLYNANFNFCRPHGSLRHKDEQKRNYRNSPAKEAGLIAHNWTLKELLTFSYHKISTNH
jgi:IS1 family transposase